MMCHWCCYTKPRILLESLQGPGGARVSCIDVNPQVVFLSKRCQMVPTGFKFTSIYHILQEKIGTPWTLLLFMSTFNLQTNSGANRVMASLKHLCPLQNLWRRRYHLFLGGHFVAGHDVIMPMVDDTFKEIKETMKSKKLWENRNNHRARQ